MTTFHDIHTGIAKVLQVEYPTLAVELSNIYLSKDDFDDYMSDCKVNGREVPTYRNQPMPFKVDNGLQQGQMVVEMAVLVRKGVELGETK